MQFKHSKRFQKQFVKLELPIQRLFQEKLSFLELDINHPSLRAKKMQGFSGPDIWELSLNMNYRATFEKRENDVIFFRKIGEHDLLLNP